MKKITFINSYCVTVCGRIRRRHTIAMAKAIEAPEEQKAVTATAGPKAIEDGATIKEIGKIF
jgi:hypothetical protein